MPREQEIEFRTAVSKPVSASGNFSLALALTISLLMHLALLQLGFSGSSDNSLPSRPVLQIVIAEAMPDIPPAVPPSLSPASLAVDTPEPTIEAAPAEKTAPAEPAPTEPAPPDLLPAETPPVFMTAPAIPDGFQIGDSDGFVTLELTVGIDGRIVESIVMEAGISEEYVEAIVQLSRETLYKPARRGNRPVSGKAIIRFEYRPAVPLHRRYEWNPDYAMDQG